MRPARRLTRLPQFQKNWKSALLCKDSLQLKRQAIAMQYWIHFLENV
jgi:hypothetical protein